MTTPVLRSGLRILVAACLVADAVVHLQLAGDYAQASAPGHLSEGLLFRVEAIAALVVALLVLAWGSRATFAAAFVVAGSAFIAVILFRYVDVPAFGPVPSMYEPIWFAKKSTSAVAEGLGAALSAIGFFHAGVAGRRTRGPSPADGSADRFIA
ncbi:hypothetical protein [Leekyejoonella antrihumi]|uniref:hypothetical protein n=1 Tax=Leekyejoonella antrihumi TaxID=1660198 RepID=UPI001648568C|nr:hypothetical protein [Leekyejoonella antrihumi]